MWLRWSGYVGAEPAWSEAGKRAEVFSGRRGKNASLHMHPRRKSFEPPEETVREWQQALDAPQSLTECLCGDPRRGRSALDKKSTSEVGKRFESLSVNGRRIRYCVRGSRPITLAKRCADVEKI